MAVARILADPDISDALRAAAEEVIDGTPERSCGTYLETGRYEWWTSRITSARPLARARPGVDGLQWRSGACAREVHRHAPAYFAGLDDQFVADRAAGLDHRHFTQASV
ncbi:hypothetical protein GCM10023238_11700 [Streptomyces heliomycini]